jgi:type I restriction enzyme M protein
MADERTNAPRNESSFIPAGLDWKSLTAREGPKLEIHYQHILEELGKEPGITSRHVR